MDDMEDVEETLQRLQRECLLDGSDEGNGLDIGEQFTPSYCYGCARTAGVAVYRKPLPKDRKRGTSSSSIDVTSANKRPKQSKSRPVSQVRSASNLQVSAKIKKKAVSTLLGQKSGLATSNHTSQGSNTKNSKRSKGRGAFPCDKCGRVFTFIYNLKRHLKHRSCVITTGQHTCSECGETFSTKNTYLQHLKVHEHAGFAVDEYLCRECGDTFAARKAYLQHLKSHKVIAAAAPGITDPDRPYACGECDKSFSRFMYLSQHKKIHDLTRPYGCQYCGRMFKSKYQLTCHEDMHLNIKPFPCQICGMAFTRDSYRKVHQRVHTKTIHV